MSSFHYSLPGADQLGAWLSRLVQIPSVTPDQAGPQAGQPGEKRLASELSQWFQQFGAKVVQEDILPGRPNVYATWPGQSSRWLAVDVHMDTVGVELMSGDPFSGEIKGGRVYGRGAVDTKASLAIVLALLEQYHQNYQKMKQPLPHNLLVVATMDEETAALGAPAFAKWVRAQDINLDNLLVAEATLCRPAYGHKGVARMNFDITGKPAHTSQPHKGENAIIAAAQVIMAMEMENQILLNRPRQSALDPATLTVSLVQGGSGINIVPDRCQVSIDRRVTAGEEASQVNDALYNLAKETSPLPLTRTVLKQSNAFWQAPDAAWVKQLAIWAEDEPIVVPYGTNAWAYEGLARETVIMGPGSIDQAHGVEEWVAISELEKMAQIYAKWWGFLGE